NGTMPRDGSFFRGFINNTGTQDRLSTIEADNLDTILRVINDKTTNSPMVSRSNSFRSYDNFRRVGINIGTGDPAQQLEVKGSVKLHEHIYDINNITGATLDNAFLSSVAGGVVWKDL